MDGQPSILLVGKNGTGKSTVGNAFEFLQRLARGERIEDIVSPEDFARASPGAPMRFELELELEGVIYKYELALELPEKFTKLRVREESLSTNGQSVFSRQLADVSLEKPNGPAANFGIDWHLAGLAVIQEHSHQQPLAKFRGSLRRTLVLQPIPPADGRALGEPDIGANAAIG